MHRIKFTQEERLIADKVATEAKPETYQLHGINKPRNEQKRRIRVGILGRIAFFRFLNQEGYVTPEIEEKLTVRDGKTVSVRTASRFYASRIIVPEEEFIYQARDYYVGVRIYKDETFADIIGYATRADMERFGVYDRGEGLGYEQELRNLHAIEKLIEQFPRIPKRA